MGTTGAQTRNLSGPQRSPGTKPKAGKSRGKKSKKKRATVGPPSKVQASEFSLQEASPYKKKVYGTRYAQAKLGVTQFRTSQRRKQSTSSSTL